MILASFFLASRRRPRNGILDGNLDGIFDLLIER